MVTVSAADACNPPGRRPVLLLHGLWMRSLSVQPLARRLRAAGFDCHRFDYPTVRGTPQRAIERLGQYLQTLPAGGCDLVAHSLGGLVALEALMRTPTLAVNRVVCLGSPLRGSATADSLQRWKIGPTLLGCSADLLRRGVPEWSGRAEVGVIAGDRPFGLGRLLGALPPPHDGTVSVTETRLPGISDHVVLHCTHTGMLFSDAVARQALNFLRYGRFSKSKDRG